MPCNGRKLDTPESRFYNARCFGANNHQNIKPNHRFLTVAEEL
jgi:ribosomal protein S27E